MTSILTNTGAMVALQTLKGVNKDLGMIQSQISTGKSIATAKDNSAVWAISKTMESDVSGFNGIKDALNNGSAMVGVARNAAETITDLLTQIKEKVVAAQDPAADTAKLATDATALRDQITAVVGAAQFNGINLVDGSGNQNVLASLDRDATGNVSTRTIQVTGQNLSTTGAAALSGTVFSTGATANDFTFADNNANGYDTATAAIAGSSADIVIADGVTAGEVISFDLIEQDGTKNTVSYTVTAGDVAAGSTQDAVAANLKGLIDGLGITDLTVDFDPGTTAGELVFTSGGTNPPLTIVATARSAGAANLSDLTNIIGTISTGQALTDVETLIGRSIDAAASFGSVQGRIETQQSFVSNLTDSLKTGIGALVDADMEEASARLQALQVQQQLAVQSLSIANQAPQTVLSLFR